MLDIKEQPGASAIPAPKFLSLATETIVPAAFASKSGRCRSWIPLPVGFSVLVLSILAGEQVRAWLHLFIPGNVLGLFILLLCFQARLLSPQLIEEAANRLLHVLPALFIPLFVCAIDQEQFWSKLGWVLLPILIVATATLWVFVGHLAQRLLCRSSQDE